MINASLVVQEAAGKTLAENDDRGGLKARIFFRPPTSGTYRIVASSMNMQGRGSFVLEVREE
jgi:hypothetical protein